MIDHRVLIYQTNRASYEGIDTMSILSTAKESRQKERKKKPDELLSSVVRETAIPAAVELLKNNEKFVFPSGTAWVMLVLDSADIGGLSRRHGRDEDKGSIIELIASDQIETVATSEMLAAGVFGIIPTKKTLARMIEYSLLTNAPYSWAVVWQRPSGDLIVDLVHEARFAEAQAISVGRLTLEAAVGPEAWREHSGVDDAITGLDDDTAVGVKTADPRFPDAPHPTHPASPISPVDGRRFDDEMTAFSPKPVSPEEMRVSDPPPQVAQNDAPTLPPMPAPEPQQAVVQPEYYTQPQQPEYYTQPQQPAPQEYQQVAPQPGSWVEEAPYEEVEEPVALEDQEAVRDVIARRFLSEDLNLDIRLEEFEATFAIGAPIVQIDPPQGSTEWLGSQVAQLNWQANADLAQQRFAHEDELRALYVSLNSKLVEEVAKKVATDRDGSRYHALRASAERTHAQRLAEKDQKVRMRRSEIIKEYEANAKRIAEHAALQAEVQFKERNRAKAAREQAEAAAEIERMIEDAYAHDLQEILRVRRTDAELQMQVGQTAIMEVVAERHKAMLAEEEHRMAEWTKHIASIVEDNRQADIVRSRTLAEQQRTTDALAKQRQEYEHTIEVLRSKHADRTRRLEDELERGRQDAMAQMNAREAEWQHALQLEKVKADNAVQRNTELMANLNTIEKEAEQRVSARFNAAVADRDRANAELERAATMQSRANYVWIAFMVAMGLICFGAGYIVSAGLGG